jgi:hypothetical protein
MRLGLGLGLALALLATRSDETMGRDEGSRRAPLWCGQENNSTLFFAI